MRCKTPRLRDRLAEVDDTWHVYCMGLETKLLGSGILNFGSFAARGTPNLARTPTAVLIFMNNDPQQKVNFMCFIPPR